MLNGSSFVFLESRHQSRGERIEREKRSAVLFLAAKSSMDIKHGRYSNRTSLAVKITCGVLPSYDRVDQFPKTRRKVGFVTAGVEINRGCTRRTRPVEIETEPGTFVQTERGPKPYPRTIHFNILFRYGSISLLPSGCYR